MPVNSFGKFFVLRLCSLVLKVNFCPSIWEVISRICLITKTRIYSLRILINYTKKEALSLFVNERFKHIMLTAIGFKTDKLVKIRLEEI